MTMFIYAKFDVQAKELELYSSQYDCLDYASNLRALGENAELLQAFEAFANDGEANQEIRKLIAKYGKSKIKLYLQ